MEIPAIKFQWHEFENQLGETQGRLDADPYALTESLEIWFRSHKEPEIAILSLAKLTREPGPGSLTPGPKFQTSDPVSDYPPHPTVFPAKPEDAFDCMTGS